ncbi:unnamed protein product [Prorocentrum cordatum]|uniref:Uncharacterized protein n=1 Tax=Prorocentrum cordatum TaxID=2364126 RepID=A0ABN9QZP6_9DINO|nr:unnamed protein product [Polarella glacialis]
MGGVRPDGNAAIWLTGLAAIRLEHRIYVLVGRVFGWMIDFNRLVGSSWLSLWDDSRWTDSMHAPTRSPTPAPTSSPTPAPTSSPTPAQTSPPISAPTSSRTPGPTSSPTPALTSSPSQMAGEALEANGFQQYGNKGNMIEDSIRATTSRRALHDRCQLHGVEEHCDDPHCDVRGF